MIMIRLLGLLFALLACAALCYGVILWAGLWRNQPKGQLSPDSQSEVDAIRILRDEVSNMPLAIDLRGTGLKATSSGAGFSAIGSGNGHGIHVSREVAKQLVKHWNHVEDFRESIGRGKAEHIEWHDRPELEEKEGK